MDKEKKYKGFWKHIFPYMKPHSKKLIVTIICAMGVGIFISFNLVVISDEPIPSSYQSNICLTIGAVLGSGIK